MKTGKVFYEKLSRGKMHGEDAYPYAEDNLIAVADGLGGRGPEKYKDNDGNIFTSAYIGANTVINAIGSMMKDEINATTIKDAITQGLNEAIHHFNKMSIGVSSSLFKIFPTTLALAYLDNDTLRTFWCGDSRVYVLSSSKGLIQVSKDDLADEELDPYKNINESGQMSQYISLSSDYVINESIYEMENENAAVFVASDGMFDYFESPMNFEFFLLNKLQESDSFDEFICSVQNGIVEITGDDVSAGFIFYGSEIYEDWKNSTKDRLFMLRKAFETIEKNREMIEGINALITKKQSEKKEIIKEIMSEKAPDIAMKIVQEKMTDGEKEKVNIYLSQEMKEKVNSLLSKKNELVRDKAELEELFLKKIAEDYLQRNQKKIARWTDEYKYKTLVNEKLSIHNSFSELIDELTKTENVIKTRSKIILQKLENDDFIENQIVDDIKILFEDYMELISQGAVSGKIAKKMEKYEKSMAKLCNGVVVKNKTIFLSYLYDDVSIPFGISEYTQSSIEKMNETMMGIEELSTAISEVEEELTLFLTEIDEYEKVRIFAKDFELSLLDNLFDSINTNLEKKERYENDITCLLDSMWNKYRINYEYYHKDNCIYDNSY